jgi:hypothetical protein
MKFDYSGVISSAADTGELSVIFRPEVSIRVYGPKGSREVLALVDTGSDDTVLGERVARDLDIPVSRATGPAAHAFGGHEIELSYADVVLELAQSDERLRWLAHVYFLAGRTNEETMILGHQGFLDYFTATFNGEDCVLTLEPNSLLPRSAELEM